MSALARTHADFFGTVTRWTGGEPPRVFVMRQVFSDGRLGGSRVLVGGREYEADDRQLALLRTGIAPEDLDLIELDPEEDDDA